MTNGDKVRQMTNDELEKLWSMEFEDRFIPECSQSGEDSCRYWNYRCEACPATFRNWLDAEVEE